MCSTFQTGKSEMMLVTKKLCSAQSKGLFILMILQYFVILIFSGTWFLSGRFYKIQNFLFVSAGYNADIICLQEVDRKVFSNDLEPLFSNLDYESTFSLKGGLVAEGLACFFNSNRFKLLDNTRIILAEHINKDPLFADIWEKIEQNSKLSERILNRTTAVQTTTLQSKEYDEVLLIANTHLYFHPDADHIRLLQAGLLMKYVTQVYKELQQKVIVYKVFEFIFLQNQFSAY